MTKEEQDRIFNWLRKHDKQRRKDNEKNYEKLMSLVIKKWKALQDYNKK